MQENIEIKKMIKNYADSEVSGRKAILKELISLKTIDIKKKALFLKHILTIENDSKLKSVARLYFYRYIEELKKNSNTADTISPEDAFNNGSSIEKNNILAEFNRGKILLSKEFLLEKLKDEKDPFVLASIINVISSFKNKSIGVFIVPFLKHTDPRVRANAIDTLESIGSNEYLDEVRELINDDNPRVKANAVRMISREKSSAPFLEDMLSSEDDDIKKSAKYTKDRLDNVISENQMERYSDISDSDKRKCPKCSKIFPKDMNFCNECGERLIPFLGKAQRSFCSQCGKEIIPSKGFCENCTSSKNIFKKINKWHFFVAAIVAIILLSSAFNYDDEYVSMVKNGHLNINTSISLGKAIDGFFGSPKWESIIAADGNHYVNVKGDIMYMDKKIEALLQYKVDIKSNTFEFHALEFNGIPQNVIVYSALISKMYGE